MNALVNFSFNDPPVHTITDEKKELWFPLVDILAVIETSRTTAQVVASIESGLGKGYTLSIPLSSPGGLQNTIIINEAAATYLVARSDTEAGKRLNVFLHTEVLPQIRKYGKYAPTSEQRKLEHKTFVKETVFNLVGMREYEVIQAAREAKNSGKRVNYLSRAILDNIDLESDFLLAGRLKIRGGLKHRSYVLNQILKMAGMIYAPLSLTPLGEQFGQYIIDENDAVTGILWKPEVLTYIRDHS